MNFPAQIEDNGFTYFLTGAAFTGNSGEQCARYAEHGADGEKTRDVVIRESEITDGPLESIVAKALSKARQP